MKPNFFVVGATKAGTTSISEYLRDHPNVFMSTPKEIHFFANDFPRYRFVQRMDDYLRLFSNARPEHLAIGEASVYYIYSAIALQKIKTFNPDSKIIVMLRDPVQLAYSQHSEMVFNCNETVKDFRAAWDLQAARKSGKNIPKGCRDPKVLLYEDLASLGYQVTRILNIFPKQQVHFVWLENLKQNPRKTYCDLLKFLGLPDDGRMYFPKINLNKNIRWSWLAKLSQTPPLFIVNLVRQLRLKFGIEFGSILSFIRNQNAIQEKRKPLDPQFSKHLRRIFLKDIELLEEATGRKLDHWKA